MNQATPHNPVLLLHGIWDTGKIFQKMKTYLKNQGWSVHTLDLVPNNGDVGLEVLAEQVAHYIDQTFAADVFVDLVGFSMGGIVGRYYIQRLGGINQVQRFITLSSPHNGTWTASASSQIGRRQMCPNSPFLQDLNRDIDCLKQLNFTSIWTPLDAMILPASSSHVPIGQEVKIWVPIHALMVLDQRGIKAVAAALAEPLQNQNQNQNLQTCT